MRISGHRFPYIKPKPIHGSQRIADEAKGIVKLRLIPNKELEAILLSFGSDVEVISPPELRGTIANKIRETYEKYFPVHKDCTNNS